jgi:hypothetical protein
MNSLANLLHEPAGYAARALTFLVCLQGACFAAAQKSVLHPTSIEEITPPPRHAAILDTHRLPLLGCLQGEIMNTERILAELRSERDRLNQAIAAIEGITSDGARRQPRIGPKRGRRGGISAAGRKRLSMLMKRRWAQGKMKRRTKAA